jgi:heme-degrading monooxygenase HmoA
MILEHAILDVRPESGSEFEAAFATARRLIERQPGFVSLRLERCVERPFRYLLLVEWDRLEDHTVGFRESTDYQQWRSILHHFYDPFPTVEHYESVDAAS